MLGDSVFDNGAYVGGGPDVAMQVQRLLPAAAVNSRARDGAVIADVPSQFRQVPPSATHLVVSIGGNDALRASGVLDHAVTSVAGAMTQLFEVREGFERNYVAMLDLIAGRALPTAVCTIYEPRFPERARRQAAATALAALNDVITRHAFARGLSLIDLRLICARDEDFANPIEPSVLGGGKIAQAIAAFATGHPGSAVVFAGQPAQ